MTKRINPDLPARQTVRLPFAISSMAEFRVQRDGEGDLESLRVEGHASVFDYEYKIYGGPPYGWIERIEKGAFDETMAEKPDVAFLLNHEGMPLARTKSGTLNLEVDKKGLLVRSDLDIGNPLVQTLASSLQRGDIDEMSFAFRVTEQMWAEHKDHEGDDQSLRKITKVNLNRGDVSAVTFGASDATDIDILRSLAKLPEGELAEARAVLDRRMKQTSDGMSGEVSGGMPPHLLELLRIQDNPELEELLQ